MQDQKVVHGGARGDRSSSSAAAAPVARRAAESTATFGLGALPVHDAAAGVPASGEALGAGVSGQEVTFVKTYKGLSEKLSIPVARGCRWTRAW